MRESVAPVLSRAATGVGQSLMASVFGPGTAGGGGSSGGVGGGGEGGTTPSPSTIVEGGSHTDDDEYEWDEDEDEEDEDDDDFAVIVGGVGGGGVGRAWMGAQTVADLGADGWDLLVGRCRLNQVVESS
jgi:hypothetical protein